MSTQQSSDEDIPTGAVVDGETLTHSVDDIFDVVVVG